MDESAEPLVIHGRLEGVRVIHFEWESSVLMCYDNPDHCKLCKFIDGDRSEDVMLEVIRILDETLADRESYTRKLNMMLLDSKP